MPGTPILRITDIASATALRNAARAAVFPLGWPTETPTVGTGTPPIANSPGTYFSLTSPDGRVVGYWRPSSGNPSALLIVIQGHAAFDTIGVGDLIRAAVAQGVIVLGMSIEGMPGFTFRDHDAAQPPLSSFVYPLAVALNHVNPLDYWKTVITGISGGGWTTTLYAALDSRISHSIPVSGSYPLWLRNAPDIGDWEQGAKEPSVDFWGKAGFPPGTLSYEEAYALGAINGSQTQVLNPNDSCCFHGDGRHSQYTPQVQAKAAIGGGSFSVVLDTTIPNQHAISQYAITNIILPKCGVPVTTQILDSHSGAVVLTPSVGPVNVNTPNAWSPWNYADPSIGYGGNVHTASKDGVLCEATYSFTVSPGLYHVAATWVEHGNRAKNTQFRVNGQTVVVNQENVPHDFVANGKWWDILKPSLVVTGTNLTVVISNAGADEYVVADAIRIERIGDLPPPAVIVSVAGTKDGQPVQLSASEDTWSQLGITVQ